MKSRNFFALIGLAIGLTGCQLKHDAPADHMTGVNTERKADAEISVNIVESTFPFPDHMVELMLRNREGRVSLWDLEGHMIDNSNNELKNMLESNTRFRNLAVLLGSEKQDIPLGRLNDIIVRLRRIAKESREINSLKIYIVLPNSE